MNNPPKKTTICYICLGKINETEKCKAHVIPSSLKIYYNNGWKSLKFYAHRKCDGSLTIESKMFINHKNHTDGLFDVFYFLHEINSSLKINSHISKFVKIVNKKTGDLLDNNKIMELCHNNGIINIKSTQTEFNDQEFIINLESHLEKLILLFGLRYFCFYYGDDYLCLKNNSLYKEYINYVQSYEDTKNNQHLKIKIKTIKTSSRELAAESEQKFGKINYFEAAENKIYPIIEPFFIFGINDPRNPEKLLITFFPNHILNYHNNFEDFINNGNKYLENIQSSFIIKNPQPEEDEFYVKDENDQKIIPQNEIKNFSKMNNFIRLKYV